MVGELLGRTPTRAAWPFGLCVIAPGAISDPETEAILKIDLCHGPSLPLGAHQSTNLIVALPQCTLAVSHALKTDGVVSFDGL